MRPLEALKIRHTPGAKRLICVVEVPERILPLFEGQSCLELHGLASITIKPENQRTFTWTTTISCLKTYFG